MKIKNKLLTAKEFDFCVAIARGDKEVDAYRAAFRPCESLDSAAVSKAAAKTLKRPRIIKRIEELRAPVIKKMKFEAEEVLGRWIKIANAWPGDLVQLRRQCCRYCYGIDHQFQWVEIDYALLVAKCINDKAMPPDDAGGYGFNGTLEPNIDCPKCFGDGVAEVYITDTRKLRGGAKILFDGIKKTKDGWEVKILDRMAALDSIAKYLGMFKDKIVSPPSTSASNVLALPALSTITTDPREAARIYQEIMAGK